MTAAATTKPGSAVPRVLVADDELGLLESYARILRRAGYEVSTALDGERAIAMLREERYDVVVSDVMMPRMTGVDLLRVVREHDEDLPVVLVTASRCLQSAIDAVRYGALRYLTKPVQLSELREVVATAVDSVRLARAKREALTLLCQQQRLEAERREHDERFKHALSTLWMAYQPIVAWSSRRVFAHEALVRSDDAALGRPGTLFEAAEHLEQTHLLGRLIRAAVATTAQHASVPTFVNLHARDLADESLYAVDGPLTALADRVVLEITERAALDDVAETDQRIVTLRRMGFRIAVDDLGAGYAGLTSFARLQPDVVKLDMSLVRGIDTDPTRQRLVASMLDVCRDLGMLAVLEGVETVAERDVLVDLGADLFQGYLFARPAREFPPVAWT